MLRTIGLFRPTGSGIELHSHEIANFLVDAVEYLAGKTSLWAIPMDFSAQWNGSFQLQAGPGGRDILEQSDRLPSSPSEIFPANFYHVCAQHADFGSPFLHECHIGGVRGELYRIPRGRR
jgi:hypothetical protein